MIREVCVQISVTTSHLTTFCADILEATLASVMNVLTLIIITVGLHHAGSS